MKKSHVPVTSVKMTDALASYIPNCEFEFIYFNIKFKLNYHSFPGPNKMMKIKIFEFCFLFCSRFALTIPLYDFDLSFLKIMQKKKKKTKKNLSWYCKAQGIPVIFYSSKIK